MPLKGLSFELGPSFTDGLAIAVDRFGADESARMQYEWEPHLKCHLRDQPGWFDVWPSHVGVRLLSLSLGAGMDEHDALEKINGPIKAAGGLDRP